MKIACLWVPELSLIAALRAEPQLCTEPLAVVQAGLGGRAHVLGATGAAAGVEAGQTLAEARAICPRLLSREASPERERAAAQAAREAASAVSPRVEEAGPGLVYLDVSGLESLIGDDRAVARAVVAAAERVGVRAPAVRAGAARRAAGTVAALRPVHARRGGGPAARTACGAVGAGGCAALAAGARGGLLRARPASGAFAVRGRRRAGVGRLLGRAAPLRLEGASRPPGATPVGARADGARAAPAAPAGGRIVGRARPRSRRSHPRGRGAAPAVAPLGRVEPSARRRARAPAHGGDYARSARADAPVRLARGQPDAARGGGGPALGAGRAGQGGAAGRAGSLGAVRGGVPQVRASVAAPGAVSAGDRGLARFARAAAPPDGGGALRRFGRAAPGDRRGRARRPGGGLRGSLADGGGMVDGRAARVGRVRPGAGGRTFDPRRPRAGHRHLAHRGCV